MELLISVVVIFLLLFKLAIKAGLKQSKNDWDTLRDLKQKASNVSTKEEIEELYKEFAIKASKIHNEYITPELNRIDGYLRGLYKNLNK